MEQLGPTSVRALFNTVHGIIANSPDGLTSTECENIYRMHSGDPNIAQFGYETFDKLLLSIPSIYPEREDTGLVVFRTKTVESPRAIKLHAKSLKSTFRSKLHRPIICLVQTPTKKRRSPVQRSSIEKPDDLATESDSLASTNDVGENEENISVNQSVPNEKQDNFVNSFDKFSNSNPMSPMSANENMFPKMESPSRPRLLNTERIRKIVEQQDEYNKRVDQRMPNETAKCKLGDEFSGMSISTPPRTTKGRGEPFGRLRSENYSTDDDRRISRYQNRDSMFTRPWKDAVRPQMDDFPPPPPPPQKQPTPPKYPNYNIKPETTSRPAMTVTVEKCPSSASIPMGTKVGGGFGSRRPVMNVNTDAPKSSTTPTPITPAPTTTIPPKKPIENVEPKPFGQPPFIRRATPPIPEPVKTIPSPPSDPETTLPKPRAKPVRHEYYSMYLYGNTQDESIAKRIESTVRSSEIPSTRLWK